MSQVLAARIAAVVGFLAVALGAFGAHGLKARVDAELLAVFETGVRYQMYHALALFAVAWAMERWPESSAGPAGWAFLVGVGVNIVNLLIILAIKFRVAPPGIGRAVEAGTG